MNIAYRLREEAKMLSPETEQSTEYILLEAAEHIERLHDKVRIAEANEAAARSLMKADREKADRETATHVKRRTTLRDEFAMAAMQGELAAQGEEGVGQWLPPFGGLANNCYEIADAMLAEREKGE